MSQEPSPNPSPNPSPTPNANPQESQPAPEPQSALGRIGAFVGRHPTGVLQSILFFLAAVVVLQNVESTSIDVLFWSVHTFPKIVLIFLSMLLGAAVWEVLRRRLGR